MVGVGGGGGVGWVVGWSLVGRGCVVRFGLVVEGGGEVGGGWSGGWEVCGFWCGWLELWR